MSEKCNLANRKLGYFLVIFLSISPGLFLSLQFLSVSYRAKPCKKAIKFSIQKQFTWSNHFLHL